MKIAIGMNIQEGAFGGGNQFGKALSEYLSKHGHEVFFDLQKPDLDLILMTDPRTWLKSVSFGPVEVMKYVRRINPNTILVHRVNECDERKGTRYMNKLLSRANFIMDHTVYVGSWLFDLFRNQGLQFTLSYSIIKNGADPNVFRFKQKNLHLPKKIKLVTHHWAANWKKGWDVYMHLDAMLEQPKYQDRFELHFIGNVPERCRPKHIFLHQPRSGGDLAQLLSSCDIYLTASINEPGANHPVEGALCGLPLLYRNSGSLQEYCEGYGEMFTGVDDIMPALETLITKYPQYVNHLTTYSQTSEQMCQEYDQLFMHLLAQRDKFLCTRKRETFSFKRALRMSTLFSWDRLVSKFDRT